MSKRTLFLIFALLIITAVLLAIAVYKPSAPAPSLVPTSIPKEAVEQTELLFGEAAVAAASPGAAVIYSLPVNISTGKNKVNAVQLELQYDPLVITNVAVVPGPFFTNPDVLFNENDSKTGRLSYAFAAGLRSPGVTGQGVAAILTFSVKDAAAQKTAVIFLPKTLVTAEGISQSVLKTTNAAEISLGEKNSTPNAE